MTSVGMTVLPEERRDEAGFARATRDAGRVRRVMVGVWKTF